MGKKNEKMDRYLGVIDPATGALVAVLAYKSGVPSGMETILKDGYRTIKIVGGLESLLGLSKKNTLEELKQKNPTGYKKYMEYKEMDNKTISVGLLDETNRQVGEVGSKILKEIGAEDAYKKATEYTLRLLGRSPVKGTDSIPKDTLEAFINKSYPLITKSNKNIGLLDNIIKYRGGSMDKTMCNKLIETYGKLKKYNISLNYFYEKAPDGITSKELETARACQDSLSTAIEVSTQQINELIPYPKHLNYTSEATTLVIFLGATYLAHRALKPVKKTIKIGKSIIDIFKKNKGDKDDKGSEDL